MCSIFSILDIKTDASKLRQVALEMSKLLRHRGPDWSGIYADDKAILAHERLSIVDVDHGAQPLISLDGNIVLAVNGEIYNHKQLKAQLGDKYQYQTNSDCEVILSLYQEYGCDFLDKLNGIFAFVLYDKAKGTYLIGRDHMGIIPLYTGLDSSGNFYVASEMKALMPVCKTVAEFYPGQYLYSADGKPTQYYHRDWRDFDAVKDNPASIEELREALEAAVKRQLMSDVPYGVLLSGGLDSSVISAITQTYAKHRIENDGETGAWWPQLHSFAVGLAESPDLVAAQKVADAIGTIHHPIVYTFQEGLDAIKEVIYHLETYDVTTIRAATPMYLMARKIKAMGIKMVLSGEGADELFGGYLYFHKAPNAQAFHEELVRKLDKLHLFDCLRANKAMAAWGLEARVPFLDKEFIDVAMRINPEAKMSKDGRIEKHILRQAFEHKLPKEVVWRQKEQFSDGVGYSWIDGLKAHAAENVDDVQFANAKFRFPYNTPESKEAYFYRSFFEEFFPLASAAETVPGGKTVACSTPEALLWDASLQGLNDPSGRAVKNVHASAY
ncbi:asparagine synthase B [Shewanella frigidimarina]|jgi:asparagine synthase (glutamine-hydrolysing)|uniref:asparagine synthase (glutamine-hydrolyzing) n=2 Tax=Shewanella frigidimarina TaxID=56812 RepID=Q083W2_SHEFN|nr:asparagine synthase B [Shewanella frigidimarina]ABI71453.1 asparagine synthase (glutamine-hydrolyzing) [Shewanella frigidimarina NCIMB 400]KVX02636.1 asparagine synthase B [Shewanella frigidimarina]MBB1381943.1 asparagine synthase B [Shewanella sp. SR41-2]RPA23495.1 asparagine synthase B [Shewanella frigidimarina]|tara:strand:- start:12244 stop:13908 length:1665 start_codon:yes stop_codon:yes gene_type:complete